MFCPTLSLLLLARIVLCISLPKLLGPSLVGTVSLELVDYSRDDPYAPTPRPRDLMISVFYPVEHVGRYSLAPAYTPRYAAVLDADIGLKPGTAASVISQAYAGAYLHTNTTPNLPPVLFFSPGYGVSRVDYTAAISNLASHGYVVVGVDHPYDTLFIDYPDGRNATHEKDLLASNESIIAAVDTRVKDMQFVLDILSTNDTIARQIPGVHSKINKSSVGIFGHSFGGATAAGAMFADSRFVCGANMDGSVFGPVVEGGLSKPFLLMNTDFHNRTSDLTLAALWENLKGWKLELTVLNSTHPAFMDLAVLYDELRAIGEIPDIGDFFGTIGGKRMLEIEYAYLSAFFDMCLGKEKEPLLDGPSDRFPEVVVWPS